MWEQRLKKKTNEQAKVISSLGKFSIEINGQLQVIHSLESELTKTRKKLEHGMEGSKREVSSWRDEARQRKAEAGRLKCCVGKFEQFFRCA